MLADDEFHATLKNKLGTFPSSREIEFRPGTVRRHNKLGISERKHGTLKRIFSQLEHDHSEVSDAVNIYRETFLSNVFAGTHTLSAL